MATLPTEGDSILVVHTHAVPPGSVCLERLQAIARRAAEIFEGGGHIKELQLPLDRPPELTGNLHVERVEHAVPGAVRIEDHIGQPGGEGALARELREESRAAGETIEVQVLRESPGLLVEKVQRTVYVRITASSRPKVETNYHDVQQRTDPFHIDQPVEVAVRAVIATRDGAEHAEVRALYCLLFVDVVTSAAQIHDGWRTSANQLWTADGHPSPEAEHSGASLVTHRDLSCTGVFI